MQVIEVVVGGQYGSEAKGHITAQLVREATIGSGGIGDANVINVRVAGPNAGHTVYDEAGNKFPLRQVPVGAAISDAVICYIAPGSEVEMSVLQSELEMLWAAGHKPQLLVSGEATLLEDKHKRQEGEAKLVDNIGSTGKGIGAARADRLMRKASRIYDSPEVLAQLSAWGVGVIEPYNLYNNDTISELSNQHIIIEGTQGFGLGLHAGHYPQVTSSDARAIDFLAMAGLSPFRPSVVAFVIWVVARAYPIRVAGNSGPLKGETTWEALGLPEERTTVTQKVRRVGEWDSELVGRAVQENGGAATVRLALTMADQKIPGIEGYDGTLLAAITRDPKDIALLNEWMLGIERETGAKVGAITTSPTTIIWVQQNFGA